ncbi:hypothetical protein [Maricaulis maris]|uniref:hypothetical protein n=1 Tax=Maricaulis maris TaxID=74318 RepID=UPI003B8C927E
MNDTTIDMREAKAIWNMVMHDDFRSIMSLNRPTGVRTCRACGCWEMDACWDEEHGACWWIEPDLCSHCQETPA